MSGLTGTAPCGTRGPTDRLSRVLPPRLYPAYRRNWECPVALEYFFDGLLALMAVLITWFAVFSVMKLYQGQR